MHSRETINFIWPLLFAEVYAVSVTFCLHTQIPGRQRPHVQQVQGLLSAQAKPCYPQPPQGFVTILNFSFEVSQRLEAGEEGRKEEEPCPAVGSESRPCFAAVLHASVVDPEFNAVFLDKLLCLSLGFTCICNIGMWFSDFSLL